MSMAQGAVPRRVASASVEAGLPEEAFQARGQALAVESGVVEFLDALYIHPAERSAENDSLLLRALP